MTTFRTVGLEEIDRFSAIGDAENHAAIRTYLLTSLAAGETSPSRWFVAEDGTDIVGRIVFWSLPGSDECTLDVFALRWVDDQRAKMAGPFLRHSLSAVADQGVAAVGYEHHEPDPDAHTPRRLLATLRDHDFVVRRRTIRYEHTTEFAPPAGSDVTFVGLDTVSRQDVVDAIARCGGGGDDRVFNELSAVHGPVEAAQRIVDATASMRGGSELWRLAHIDDEIVGVALATANDGGPVLNYLAVSPEHRGRRIIDQLLAEGVRLHHANGARRVVADTDDTNASMQAAFERNGWTAFGQRTTYVATLTAGDG